MTSRWSRDDVAALVRDGKATLAGYKDRLPVSVATPQKQPTKAERAAARILEVGFGWEQPMHQARVFRLRSGHDYTPDLWYPGRSVAVEVKGYRHPSVQRCRLAFDEARVQFPDCYWVWMELKKAGRGRPERWVIEWAT